MTQRNPGETWIEKRGTDGGVLSPTPNHVDSPTVTQWSAGCMPTRRSDQSIDIHWCRTHGAYWPSGDRPCEHAPCAGHNGPWSGARGPGALTIYCVDTSHCLAPGASSAELERIESSADPYARGAR